MHAHFALGAPRLEIASLFRAHAEGFRETHPLSAAARRVLRDLERCRTSALGGHLYRCEQCGGETPLYNSCLNRHCPTCQGPAQLAWIEARKKRLLPTDYFASIPSSGVPSRTKALPWSMKHRQGTQAASGRSV